jgi:selenocysteine-specific translation elongation factor
VKANFKITDSFHLKGRGLVATGDILSGRINIGDVVVVNINNVEQRLRITGC